MTRTWQQRDENTQRGSGVAWKARNSLKPHPLHPKPPWKDKKNKDKSLGIDSGVTMEWESEAEERFLATKLNTSRNPSTFVCSDRFGGQLNSSEKKETNSGELIVELNTNTDYNVQVDCYKIGAEGNNTEKAHRESPCAQNTHTE